MRSSEKRFCTQVACTTHCPFNAGESYMRRSSAAGSAWQPSPSAAVVAEAEAEAAKSKTALSCDASACVSACSANSCSVEAKVSDGGAPEP